MLQAHVGLAGRFKLEVFRGSILIEETPWFDNLVTNEGLNYPGGYYGVSGGLNRCSVGSGSTAPAYTDTELDALLAVSVGAATVATGLNSDSRWYYVYRQNRYTFSVGAIVGTVAEVGMGYDGALFSRSLIKDELGAPTTITLTSADQLFVTYEHRLYVDSQDAAISFDANGITQTGTKRIASWGSGGAYPWGVYTQPGYFQHTRLGTNRSVIYYGASALGAVSGTPTGAISEASGTTGGDQTYVKDTFYRDSLVYFGGAGTANALH